MSNTTINECEMSYSDCYGYYKTKTEYLTTINKILHLVFDRMFYQFEKHNIEKDKLVENLIHNSLTKEICSELHPLSSAFSILHNSLIYYKNTKNIIMINFIDQSLMEANLMYFEDEFEMTNELSTRDKSFLEYIIDNSF